MGSKRFVYLTFTFEQRLRCYAFKLQQSLEMDYENGTHFGMKPFTQDIWQVRTLHGNGVTNYGKKFLHKKIGKTKFYTNKHGKL